MSCVTDIECCLIMIIEQTRVSSHAFSIATSIDAFRVAISRDKAAHDLMSKEVGQKKKKGWEARKVKIHAKHCDQIKLGMYECQKCRELHCSMQYALHIPNVCPRIWSPTA
jgi:hypothetical protein